MTVAGKRLKNQILIYFSKALIGFDSEINTIHLTFAKKIGLIN